MRAGALYFALVFAAGWVLGPIRLVALGLVLVAELAGARWLRGLSIGEFLAKFVSVSGGISALLFVLFALMPMLVALPRR